MLSTSGFKYYVLFLDHFSHYLWVYPLRTKSETLSKFLHFHSHVKTQYNRNIKALQCDHGVNLITPNYITSLHNMESNLDFLVLKLPNKTESQKG